MEQKQALDVVGPTV